jgi:hypothetical protein
MSHSTSTLTREGYRALPDREKCKVLVRILAKRSEWSEPRLWGLAYWKLGQKIGIDVKAKAEAAGMSTLDWIQDTQRMANLRRAIKEIHDDFNNPRPRRARRR